jgi:hypothetical protein
VGILLGVADVMLPGIVRVVLGLGGLELWAEGEVER